MSIWSITGHFNETASRLPKVKERLSQVDKHEDMITAEKVKTAIRKILKDPKKANAVNNYRPPVDTRCCFNVYKTPTRRPRRRIDVLKTLKWRLISTGPIACLPRMWKLLTSVLVEKVYTHMSWKNVLPDEQKWCRKG